MTPLQELLTRFAKADPATGCILWQGGKTAFGYGKLTYQGKQQVTHRIVWQLIHGIIKENEQILHRCDVPSCVNPEHLFLGTISDNMKDMWAKRRARPHGATQQDLASFDRVMYYARE